MLNRVCLQGRLPRDVEVKVTTNGTQLCSFSVACQRDFKKADGTYDTDFIDCVAWRNTAVFINKHFRKGDMIIVDGRLQVDKYEKDGQVRYRTMVAVENVNFTGAPTRSEDTQQSTEPAQDNEETQQSTASGQEEDELPFEI